MLDALAIQEILPHRFPFLFVDRVVELDGRPQGDAEPFIVVEHLVSMQSPILQGHFPGNPILPGVVQVEAMAQAAVLLAHAAGHFEPARHNCLFIGIQEAKFRAMAVPGEVLRIRVQAHRLGRVGKFTGDVRAGDEPKSSANFTAIIEAKASG